jgi:hypothetical protein
MGPCPIAAERNDLDGRKLARLSAGSAPAEGTAVAAGAAISAARCSVQPGPAEEQHAKDILTRHNDKDWTLCDAISFAVLDSRDGASAFTFDRHFRQYPRIHVLGLSR